MLHSNNAADFLIPDSGFPDIEEAVSELPALFEPFSPSTGRSSAAGEAQNLQKLHSESQCCCLILALGLLKQLFPNSSVACTRSSEDATCRPPTVRSIIAENEQTVEATINMLQCQCSQDEYLLAIMSFIVFKVLGWYAAAARQTPVTDDSQRPSKSHPDGGEHSSCHSEHIAQSPTTEGGYCMNGENQGRMAAQLVLSNLHPVQRLVNLLSQRLRGHGKHNPTAEGTDTPPNSKSPSPFSNLMFDQLEVDLRKRLRALSVGIVGMLRRG